MLRALFLALPILLVTACGAPRPVVGPPGGAVADGGLMLDTPASSYLRGQPIPLTLRNTSARAYQGAVLSCAGVERWERTRWVEVDTQRACIAMLAELAPGGTMNAEIPLDLPAGNYRFTHAMTPADDADDPVRVATRAFRLGTGQAR